MERRQHLEQAAAQHVPAVAVAIILGLSGGLARADLASAFTGKVNVDTGYVTGASGATDIAFSADGRAVVTLKGGQILVRRKNGSTNTVTYPFGGTLDTGSEKGLLGVVADPSVAQNHAFYFYVSNGPTNDKHRVYRAVLNATDGIDVDFDPSVNPVVGASRGVGPGLEGPANHDGGGMWIHGGQLYIGVGDTGANASPPTNKYGSCLNKGNGKILRVNLSGTVPADNPLTAVSAATSCASVGGAWSSAPPDRRVFAWGFRNPWRIWVDPQTNLLWVGDVGEITQEEISVGGADKHYGYPFEEGSQVWGNVAGMNCASMAPSRACTPPVYSYSHSQGLAVTGGLILDAAAWAQVFGGTYYIFGDSSSNWLRALPVNGSRSGVSSTVAVEFATYPGAMPVSLRVGPDGSLYVVMYGAGVVYRFTLTFATAARNVPAMPWGALVLLSVCLALIGIGRRPGGGTFSRRKANR